MIQRKKLIAVPLLLMFCLFSVFGCTPQQTQTAKDVTTQAQTYISWAEILIEVAKTQFPDKPKVVSAMVATQSSLSTLRTAFALVAAGVEKSMDKVVAAASDLIKKVFELKAAIEEAKASQ